MLHVQVRLWVADRDIGQTNRKYVQYTVLQNNIKFRNIHDFGSFTQVDLIGVEPSNHPNIKYFLYSVIMEKINHASKFWKA